MSLFDDQPFAPVPVDPTLDGLRSAIGGCRACELWQDATQPVSGEGRAGARLMLVGEQPGDRRIHQTPERVHVSACRPWLDAELAVLGPRALVALGATAAQALLGSGVRIGRDRGVPQDSELAPLVTLTTHPSAILRTDPSGREAAMDELVADLSEVARWLARDGGASAPTT